jgi:2-(1,2-epoxy-1,2-dihydrophenyl)acetyl-CoA isomerase
MSDVIIVEKMDQWTKITLNRPECLNALNVEMHLAFRAALEVVDDARAVLITGAGRGFCAGQDLGERNPDGGCWPPDLGQTLNDYFNPLVRLITNLPMPVICAVNGVAAGAGANLALACDVVLASDTARFIQAFSKIGLVPDAGGSWILPRRLGMARAMGLALTGMPLMASQAAEWGLIWKTYDAADLMPKAQALAAEFAAGPTMAYAGTKALMMRAANQDFDAHLDDEAAMQQVCGRSNDYAEGVRAFLAKRPAEFTGK